TVAGNGTPGVSPSIGDGGPAVNANLSGPQSIAFDKSGNFYIADSGHNAVRFVQIGTGIITTVAGGIATGAVGDGGLATSAFQNYPRVGVLDSAGNLLISQQGRIRKVTTATGIITTVVGNGSQGTSGDGLPATQAEVNVAWMGVDKSNNIYIASPENEIRKVN